MIKGTVALPIWNSKDIAWLVLESLCRQVKPIDGWELVCMEEKHKTQVGESFIRSYEPRLKEAGCERIVFITSDKKFALSKKWITMANLSAPTSEYFCLCGADDYYHSHLLIESEQAIKEADWCLTTKGYFYDFHADKIITYNLNTLTGLHMTAKTKYAKVIPVKDVNCGVDGWFSHNLMKLVKRHKKFFRCYMSFSDEWEHILCTNGLNNISKNRKRYFKNIAPPFYSTDKKLSDIVPEDIYLRLKTITRSLKTHDDLA